MGVEVRRTITKAIVEAALDQEIDLGGILSSREYCVLWGRAIEQRTYRALGEELNRHRSTIIVMEVKAGTKVRKHLNSLAYIRRQRGFPLLLASTPIEVLELNVRQENGLRNAGVEMVDDLLKLSPLDLFAIRNFGRKSILDIKLKVEKKFGIEWGCDAEIVRLRSRKTAREARIMYEHSMRS